MTQSAAHAVRPITAGTGVQWPLDPGAVHLNHGSFGAVPVAVLQEQARCRQLMEADPVRWFSSLPPRIAGARVDMAGLLGVDPAHMALVLNASAGAATVFDTLASRGPMDVLVTNHGYGAATMGAQRLARRSGGRCHMLDIPLAATGSEVLARVADALTRDRPGLLVIDHITSPTARLFPVDEICRAARDLGVTTLVDGAHAPGLLAEPVCREADYWVGNLHKFACAPRGAAVLVVRGDGQELDPVIDSWGAQLPFPERFDYTGTLDSTAWLVAPFAWRHIDGAVGWETVRQRTTALLDEGVARVAEALAAVMDGDPVADVGQPIGPQRLLRLPGGLGSTREAADGLRMSFSDATGMACAFSSFDGRGYVRLSAHLYNSPRDYAYFAEVGVPLLARWAAEKVAPTA